MHLFVPYFLMTADAFGELNELRREFTDKCDQSGKNDLADQTISTQTGQQLIDNTPLELPILDIVQPKYASITPTTSEQNPIDYLALPVTGPAFIVNTKCPHLSYMSTVVNVRSVWLRVAHIRPANRLALNRLLQLVGKHRLTDGRPMTEAQWAQVANNMPRIKALNKPDVVFDPKLCQNYVQSALDLYKKALECCPSVERAGIAFPMFYTLHVFSPECVVLDAECCEIARLRELFAHRCRTSEAYIYNNPEPTGAAGGLHSPVMAYPVVAPRHITPVTKVIANPSICSTPILSLAANNDVHELNVMCAKITQDDLLLFANLCRSVDETVKTLGPFEDNRELFWSHVSQHMSKSGHTLAPTKSYQFLFIDHVSKYYKIALKYLPNYTEAVKVYPYFSVIHDMDLSQSISKKLYEKIKELRDVFTNG